MSGKQAICHDIKEMLRSGALRTGMRIPSHRELSRKYDVAIATVTRAINELKQEGIVQSVRGVGTTIAEPENVVEHADVVVFDRLVSPEILALIPPTAKAIDVGKRVNVHPVPQEEINQILLREALGGANVVRLKGGDPFLFGRGGEELELLAQHQVPFQVVPGVTSALAVPAYGGIPVTHRDCCSSLHIVTGHQRARKALDIDFDALVATKGTLVFLMGVTAMPAIVEGLLQAGMAPDTPAAMVESGTISAQRRCSATLATLPERAAAMGIHSPAIIVVGEVCALAQRFCWFDRLPLRGRKILVTRPRERAGTLSEKLRALGADVWEYPCIETAPILPCPAMTAALARLTDYQWLAFTSPAGVEAFRDELRRMGKDGRYLSGAKLAAIGTGTSRALEAMGLSPDYIPPVYDAAHLGEGIPAGGKVLILRAEAGSPALTAALDRRAIPCDDVAVYRTAYQNPRSQALRCALEAGEVPSSFTPYFSIGSMSWRPSFSTAYGRASSTWNILGIDGPKMSASSRPTL